MYHIMRIGYNQDVNNQKDDNYENYYIEQRRC